MYDAVTEGAPLFPLSQSPKQTRRITLPFAAAGGDLLKADTDEIIFGGDGDDFLDASTGGGNTLYGRDANDILVGVSMICCWARTATTLYLLVMAATLTGGDGKDQFWVAFGVYLQTQSPTSVGTDVIGIAGLSE